jgi:4-amino-4-deoxy-L-arabinose transferase-like glycosyltransferase
VNANRVGLALVIVAFCLPLFVGLGRGDLRGDEGIYSFGVDRILESGDWLAPKSSPHEDAAFLEKPPLKFWIVALPIRLGLLPHNEFGLRFWDALFGAVAFLYVYAIGRRLAGSVCGVVAVLTLFAQWALLFEHGLRSNNMEAPLFLCYCGGIYHYLRACPDPVATPGGPPGPSQGGHDVAWHAVAVALYFVLGFMTKFVAAIFLPMVLGAATLLVPSYRRTFARDWRQWIAASALALVLIAPWFAYAVHRFGPLLWQVMLIAHVYTRMTSFLEPQHVQPWYYYLSSMHRDFGSSGVEALAVAGLIVLGVQTARRRSAEGVLILLWFALPTALISLGTSKLYHYEYPFLPPVALAAGYLVSLAVGLAPAPLRRLLDGYDRAVARRVRLAAALRSPPLRALLLIAAGLAVAIGLAGLAYGEVQLHVGDVVLKSRGIFRPALVAVLFALAAGIGRGGSRALALSLAVSALPLPAYRENLAYLTIETHPMSTASACLQRVEAATPGLARGLYLDVPESSFGHPMNYYFRRVRPWTRADASAIPQGGYLTDPATWRPALLGKRSYSEFLDGARSSGDRDRDSALAVPVVALPDDVVLLLPGPYAACRTDATESGRPR